MQGGILGKTKAEVHNKIDRLMEGFLDYTTDRLSSITRYNTRKVIRKQSVMEHSGAVTLIAMVFSDYFNEVGIENDTQKVLRMAIVHDMDEVVSGDLPYDAKYSQGKLSENLRNALHELTSYHVDMTLKMMKDKKLERSYKNLLDEEHAKDTVEAKIVKLADTADTIIYSMQEEKTGNKQLFREVRKHQTVKLHSLIDDLLKK